MFSKSNVLLHVQIKRQDRHRQARQQRREKQIQYDGQIPELPKRTPSVRPNRPRVYLSARMTWKPLVLGNMNILCSYCHTLHWINEKVEASTISEPIFTICCLWGLVHLPALKPLPPFLHSLYYTDVNTVEGWYFKSLIWTYNSAIAFISVNYRQNNRIDLWGGGIHSFQIYGELYHLQGPLQLSIGRKPCFAQLYFFDPSYAAQVYTTVDINLRGGLLKSLIQELRMENP